MRRKGIVVVILLGIGGVWNFARAEQPTSPLLSSAGQALEQVIRMSTLSKEHDARQEKSQKLIDGYKSLKQGISNAQNEAEKTRLEGELKRVISEIIKIYPEAASERDVFGIPVDVDIEYVERAHKVREEMFKIQMEKEVDKLGVLSGEMSKKHEEHLKEKEVLQRQIREETERIERLIELRQKMKAAKSDQELMELKKQQDQLTTTVEEK